MVSTSNVTKGSVSSVHRQPVVLDYAQSNQFKIFLPIFPTTEYFVVRATIPSVDLGQASQPTPLIDMPIVGDKLTYSPFSLTFLVDEKYNNYIEIYNWMKNIGFPSNHRQFNSLERPDFSNRGKKAANTVTGELYETSDRDLYTDIHLTILSSKNNPIVKCTMYEGFPISMSSLDYSQQESDTDYVRCDVSFAYSWFDMEVL